MDELDNEELIGADELNEFIIQNFENLINEGYEILKLILELPPGDRLTGEEFIRVNSWITKSEQLLRKLCPKYSEYIIILDGLLSGDKFSHITNDSFPDAGALVTCLQGACSDYKHED